MAKREAMERDVAGLGLLHEEIIACRACPRLVEWREKIAREKRRAYRDWTYWGRAVPGFGDPRAGMVIVGLAPAAHGANRTGRYFTGDRSGEFLFAGLHRAGFANQPRSDHRDDGLELTGAFISAPCRCAPPDNKPLPEELVRCTPFFDRELALLPVRVVLALGSIAWNATLAWMQRTGVELPSPRPAFGHGAELAVPGAPVLLGSYHVSQQNTQTGRLTPAMFDAVTARARVLLASAREERARVSLFP
ncbi:uracil-DNA glycosylase [Cystobacter fuscus]|uniref:Type-5 uracil-DNA glycosylase n=2 Tax=Cystobacter fuscus TaxID=43 RepID=A0A250J737_9BACT|nr:uracil-DNA glycosylase [Cystobacter fuscus]